MITFPYKVIDYLEKWIDLDFPKTQKFNDLVSTIDVHIENREPFKFHFSNAKNYKIRLTGIFISIDDKKLTICYEQTKTEGSGDLDFEFLLTDSFDNICLVLKDIEHETYVRSHPIIEYPQF